MTTTTFGTTCTTGTKMEADSDGIRRSVKPRDTTKAPTWLPIIVVDNENAMYLVERTGQVGPLVELPHLFLTEPTSIVLVFGAAQMVADLDRAYGKLDTWQYRVTPVRREAYKAGERRKPVVLDTIVNYFGQKNPTRPKAKGHWHYPVDPVMFSRSGLHAIQQGDGPKFARMLAWGQDLRRFCQEQGMTVSTTGGGLAGQLLKDPRFYPAPRRKVPRKTNAHARPHLPGNYYKLFAEEGEVIQAATYLDMTAAHHNAAAGLVFPNADTLLRRGDWETTDATDTTVSYGAPLWSPDSPAFAHLLKSHGLLRLRLNVPEIPAHLFPPPYMTKAGSRTAYVHTNELAYIRELGGTIEGIEAAWTSFGVDRGLNRYATWALAELATMEPQRKLWAKPVLLSAYGVLASTPRNVVLGHRYGKGKFTELPAGSTTIKAHLIDLGCREVPVANVVHRGMIEAETRLRCLRMANLMVNHGHRVLSIYADSVIIEPSGPLALLPSPWGVEANLTRLVFYNSTSFTSPQMSKLPGIPREGMDRARRLASVRRVR